MSKVLDLTGHKYGRLHVIKQSTFSRPIKWECVCDCGNNIIVRSNSLREGVTKSCGCLSKDARVKRSKLYSVISKSYLEQMYNVENKSQQYIATILGVTQGAILYWMKKYDIKARKHDNPIITKNTVKRGKDHIWWNGGKTFQQGYVLIKKDGHPLAGKRGYVREHRYIWYENKGPIPKGWHIHHKNGIKDDNRLENLELMTHKKHRDVLPALLKRVYELEQQLEKNNEPKSR